MKTKYTTTEVAREIGTSRCTAWKMIQRGDIPATNVGAGRQLPRYRVSAEDLAAFLLARATSDYHAVEFDADPQRVMRHRAVDQHTNAASAVGADEE